MQLLAPTLLALADQPVRVLATTGGREPHGLPMPGNAWVVPFDPFDCWLPRAAALITDGGYGTVQFALSHGVPVIVAGGGEDKQEVGTRVAMAGCGRDLGTGWPTAVAMGRAVAAALRDPAVRAGARRIGLQNRHTDALAPIAATVARLAPATAQLRRAVRTLIDAMQLPVLRRQITNGGPLQLLIPAFSVKSPSPRKVLGILPDLGECLALSFLNSLCERLRLVHPPGARLLMCSDGHVFGPAVGVTDATIDIYQSHIERTIAQVGGTCLRTFSVAQRDHLPPAAEGCYEGARQALLLRHGVSLDVVRAQLLASEEGVRQFTGVLRFIREDRQHLDAALSRTAAQRMARELAYRVIQRSCAWAELLTERFPDAIRLSIHPQPPDSIKFGTHLLPTRNDCMTP